MAADIINQLIQQYTGSINNLQTGSITLGKELFNAIALISVALLGLNHLLKRNVDMIDAHIELIRWIIYLDFFYAFIVNFPSVYAFVFAGTQQIGNYLGTQASGQTVNLNPANIFQIGINLSIKILAGNISLNLFRNILYPLTSVATAAVILFCFASIGLELILVQIGSQIILVGGIFLLAFSGLQWTRDYAERYVHTFFHLGIKMVFIYIIVGIGLNLAQNWSQLVVNAPWNKVLDYDIAIGLSSYIYYKLCLKVPDQAVTWLSGRFAMGFETSTDVKAGVKAAFKTAVGIPTAAIGMAQKVDGFSRAVSAAHQSAQTILAGQGKKATVWNTVDETIKTLGAAHREVTWDKKVDESTGGKMAAEIVKNAPQEKPEIKTKAGPIEYDI